MRHYRTLLLITALVLLCSCSSERPPASLAQKAQAGGSSAAQAPSASTIPGIATLEISPREPNRKSVLSALAKGFDLPGADLQWLVNGSPVTTEMPGQFNCSAVSKGASVQAQAMVQGRAVPSNIVEIGNTRPELVNVRLLPETFKPGNTLMVEADANDIDRDPVTIIYAWTLNDAPAGNSPKIAGAVKRGDRVTVSVTPYDGQQYGTPIILNTEVRNIPPSFIEHKNFSFTGNRYTYQAQAVDPDGDVLTYALEDFDGMTIDRSTGEFSWDVPPDFKGQKSVTIMADDGHGGTARYSIVISISP